MKNWDSKSKHCAFRSDTTATGLATVPRQSHNLGPFRQAENDTSNVSRGLTCQNFFNKLAACMHRLRIYRLFKCKIFLVISTIYCNYSQYLTNLWPEIRKKWYQIIAVYMHLVIVTQQWQLTKCARGVIPLRNGPKRQIGYLGCYMYPNPYLFSLLSAVSKNCRNQSLWLKIVIFIDIWCLTLSFIHFRWNVYLCMYITFFYNSWVSYMQ